MLQPEGIAEEPARYSVFLSYNSDDRSIVETVADRLADEADLKPFLDQWYLVAGLPLQEQLETALAQSDSCAYSSALGESALGKETRCAGRSMWRMRIRCE